MTILSDCHHYHAEWQSWWPYWGTVITILRDTHHCHIEGQSFRPYYGTLITILRDSHHDHFEGKSSLPYWETEILRDSHWIINRGHYDILRSDQKVYWSRDSPKLFFKNALYMTQQTQYVLNTYYSGQVVFYIPRTSLWCVSTTFWQMFLETYSETVLYTLFGCCEYNMEIQHCMHFVTMFYSNVVVRHLYNNVLHACFD